ncbi:hypothetical protein F5878DRAFT_667711 [Lentinula raphanica]|uniref:Uncharacterized protein n=1 Tax=Lentinula raphanica TaxID=153919 RepID=A0AA38NVB8_9AGAR|nr:hypothetical protein F5878DRAFT_667711 [Lentinula raphanica]
MFQTPLRLHCLDSQARLMSVFWLVLSLSFKLILFSMCAASATCSRLHPFRKEDWHPHKATTAAKCLLCGSGHHLEQGLPEQELQNVESQFRFSTKYKMFGCSCYDFPTVESGFSVTNKTKVWDTLPKL